MMVAIDQSVGNKDCKNNSQVQQNTDDGLVGWVKGKRGDSDSFLLNRHIAIY